MKTWFDRKRIAVLGLLFIVLISLENPFSNISGIINLEINLNKARDYDCLEEHIPTGEEVLFIGNPYDDPTNSNNLALYYRSQYFFTPRLVILMESQDEISSPGLYSLFVGTTLNEDQLRELDETHDLTPVKKCGNFTLLQKSSQP
jgi:hypothetical protein